ncbi:MAG: 1-(5-phosphoribosyl)-5-[(5-phosphoribosylamino)methylideneamino]imidazole-4-carboxamide isomerase [Pelagibacterales bacterium]|nr:1-(5-phosphoribosyl)-5-[(5-phosphoribosylamino)methylideneamino]imidazole-4-carboxamide isomerase [Pelagibacterales bacterium]PPR16657.1 MAG: 1-(5-phosphoribosyl)-5-[(5-phosphoribosylamino)methylideneamino] imidazole-4-carboxamide isomerase [Alphaproteobacteria bacterium MarineAlpha9_Bin3]|tara:strand:- start:12275 stop:13000 length:726 start_codon:yes stop_codon:yes gene_type:complete
MIFFPAIDLKDGKCVRLKQGDISRSTVFDLDPVARAKSFYDAGCSWLHLVDLNGAFEGKPINHKIVESIIKNVDIKIQLGGGIRNLDTIDFWIKAGIKRLIIGTMALKKPELVIEACKKYPGKIALGIDVRNGKIATEGWVEQSQISAMDLVKKFKSVNVSAIIYTDISRDGILMGPALEETLVFAKNTNIPTIISGGVSSEKDIRQIKKMANEGILGVISGRAIYDNRLNVSECNKILGK